MGFDPYNRPLKVHESIRTPTPKMGIYLGIWRFIPSHYFALSKAWDVTPGFPSWPTMSQALTLVVSPRLGLQHEAIMCSMEVVPMKDWESTQVSISSILFDILKNNEQVDENDATIIENFIGNQSRFFSNYNFKMLIKLMLMGYIVTT
jgi:hypothetical protein